MKVITIGRNPENDIVIDDAKVSRTHLQIAQDDNGNFLLVAFNTTNGTLLNGKEVQGDTPLQRGDVVKIGNTVLPWESYFTPECPPIPAPKSKNWWIAILITTLLFIGSGITFKILDNKEQAKIEALKEVEKEKQIEAENKIKAVEKFNDFKLKAEELKLNNGEYKYYLDGMKYIASLYPDDAELKDTIEKLETK